MNNEQLQQELNEIHRIPNSSDSNRLLSAGAQKSSSGSSRRKIAEERKNSSGNSKRKIAEEQRKNADKQKSSADCNRQRNAGVRKNASSSGNLGEMCLGRYSGEGDRLVDIYSEGLSENILHHLIPEVKYIFTKCDQPFCKRAGRIL